MRSLRRSLVTMGSVALTGFVAVLIFSLWPTSTGVLAAPLLPESSLIEKGRYLSAAGDCAACHTAPGSKPFAGGLAVNSPLGAIYSTNITPDRGSGIGDYSLSDFDRALRHGIRRDGTTLYPAMPYPSYARLTDEDVMALYAYFMHGVEPAHARNRASGIPWPLSIRWPLAAWRKLFAPSVEEPSFEALRYADPVIARGAYLVQGPGHCGGCHTPRGLTFQERALDERGAAYLSGGPLIDGWVAVNLRGNAGDGLGDWTVDDIVRTMRSARNQARAVTGQPMGDAVVHGTQYLTDADLQAIARYLKTLSPARGHTSAFEANAQTALDLASGVEPSRGAELYIDNCSACHRTNGEGATGVFPAIAGNSSVLTRDAASIVRLILNGGSLPATVAAPSTLGMPCFGWRLSDQEVADLASFIRTSWGNSAPAVWAAQVRKIRHSFPADTSCSG